MNLTKFVLCCCIAMLPSCSDSRRREETDRTPEKPSIQAPPAAKTRISGPYTYENLTIFLVHGPDAIDARNFMTLQEALKQGQVRVFETGNVNELAIENLSDKEEVFIQAGEIVRGGKQDRCLAVDLILEPRSGRIPIASFCVEHGRWQRRGGEDADGFQSSARYISSNDLRLAVQWDADQGKVWASVSQVQADLSENLGGDVAARLASSSSLELTLDDAEVKKHVAEYVKALTSRLDGQADALGLVVAVNGRLLRADVYGAGALFRKLSPKLLESCAVEAVASRNDQNPAAELTVADVETFLAVASDGKTSTRTVSQRVRLVTCASVELVRFDTIDSKTPEAVVHRSYLKQTQRSAESVPQIEVIYVR